MDIWMNEGVFIILILFQLQCSEMFGDEEGDHTFVDFFQKLKLKSPKKPPKC